MSSAATDILRDTFRDAREDDVARTVGVFIATFTIGMVVYALAVLFAVLGTDLAMNGVGSTAPETDTGLLEGLGILAESLGEQVWEYREYVLMMVIPAIPAAVVHTRLPERTVDRYHRFGKAFAMFATVNLTLSAMFLYLQYGSRTTGFIGWFIVNFSLASAFLPGPYIGVLLGSRWCGGDGDE